MKILVIDIGGTHIKFLASNQKNAREFDSGKTMTPQRMVDEMTSLVEDWEFEAVTIGYPGVLNEDGIVKEPKNLGPGWVGFDFEAALNLPVKMVNDAAMQALGSYQGGKLLFLGLGTGLGSAMVIDGLLVPLELAHLPYKNDSTFEDYVGIRGQENLGMDEWRASVGDVVNRLTAAFQPDEVVLGGGNANLNELPYKGRLGDNSHAFLGGFRLWEKPCERHDCHWDSIHTEL